MFRILPVAIFIMIGFFIYKASSHNDIMSEIAVVPHGEVSIDDIEPAAGDDEAKDETAKVDEDLMEGSGHARDGAAQEGKESLGTNESGLPDYVSFTPPKEEKELISESEKRLLEKLRNRREELEAWEKELTIKAGTIEASSRKLDGKIAELEKLKKQTEKIISEYQNEEDSKIGSLVKIYESMKPKDAAKVFDQMDIDIMLSIIDKMSERKAAPILAKLNTRRAKEITEKIANQRSLAQARGIASR